VKLHLSGRQTLFKSVGSNVLSHKYRIVEVVVVSQRVLLVARYKIGSYGET
jgi:hypothetical protein